MRSTARSKNCQHVEGQDRRSVDRNNRRFLAMELAPSVVYAGIADWPIWDVRENRSADRRIVREGHTGRGGITNVGARLHFRASSPSVVPSTLYFPLSNGISAISLQFLMIT